jgi:hypothetical protein
MDPYRRDPAQLCGTQANPTKKFYHIVAFYQNRRITKFRGKHLHFINQIMRYPLRDSDPAWTIPVPDLKIYLERDPDPAWTSIQLPDLNIFFAKSRSGLDYSGTRSENLLIYA